MFPVGPINGLQTLRLALGAPAMGLIVKALVVQLNQDGSVCTTGLEGFSYAFYNSAVACPPSPTQQGTPTSAEPSVLLASEVQGQVSQTFVVPSGKDRYYLADGVTLGAIGLNIPYLNCDGGLSNAKDLLYMKLIVPGTATLQKYFGVFMGIGHYRG
jgi:hypothetical protein